jgi:hypothetical protein
MSIAEFPPVIRKIGNALIIVALVVTIGGHWAALQTVAWATMFASNLHTESFGQAVVKTFDGKNPCSLCKVVSAGKKAEQKTDLPLLVKKFEFVSHSTQFVFASPQDYWLRDELIAIGSSHSHAPLLPPPRRLA